MISAQPFLNRPRPMLCKSVQMGSWPITFLWLWPHEPHSWHVPTDKIRRRTETNQCSAWCSHMAGINSDYSTHEMKWIPSVDNVSWNVNSCLCICINCCSGWLCTNWRVNSISSGVSKTQKGWEDNKGKGNLKVYVRLVWYDVMCKHLSCTEKVTSTQLKRCQMAINW